MRFHIDDTVWQLFPHLHIGVVVARGLDNSVAAAEASALLLADAAHASATRLSDADLATHPAIVPWREAYRAFGAKPAKYRSSIENLLRSARAGSVRAINPLVDLYNAVSLTHWLPCGGEDLAAIRGEIRLTRAAGGESFTPLGSTEEQPPQPGEIIYRDAAGVLCRCWNWRETERTKLTAATTDAFLCIEALPPVDAHALDTACRALAALVQQRLGGTTSVALLSRAVPALELDTYSA